MVTNFSIIFVFGIVIVAIIYGIFWVVRALIRGNRAGK